MMSVLMGIQGGTRDKKFIPAACAQWGGIRHTGLFTAAIKAAVGGAVCGHPCFPALFLCCAADAMAWIMGLSCLCCLLAGEGGRT